MLKSLDKEDLEELLHRALTEDIELKKKHIELQEKGALMRFSGGALASAITML